MNYKGEKYYTYTQTAEILGVTRRTVYNMVERGALKSIRVLGGKPMIPASEIM